MSSTMSSRIALKYLATILRAPKILSPSPLRPYPRLPRTLQPFSQRFVHNIPRPPPTSTTSTSPDQHSLDKKALSDDAIDEDLSYKPIPRKLREPHYQLTFTCVPCSSRSSHTVSKQGYHNGSVLITCPECRNRHIISDNLKIFGERNINIEDIMREKGQLVKRGTIGYDGDIEFWADTPSNTAGDGGPHTQSSASVTPGDAGHRPSIHGPNHHVSVPSTKREFHTNGKSHGGKEHDFHQAVSPEDFLRAFNASRDTSESVTPAVKRPVSPPRVPVVRGFHYSQDDGERPSQKPLHAILSKEHEKREEALAKALKEKSKRIQQLEEREKRDRALAKALEEKSKRIEKLEEREKRDRALAKALEDQSKRLEQLEKLLETKLETKTETPVSLQEQQLLKSRTISPTGASVSLQEQSQLLKFRKIPLTEASVSLKEQQLLKLRSMSLTKASVPLQEQSQLLKFRKIPPTEASVSLQEQPQLLKFRKILPTETPVSLQEQSQLLKFRKIQHRELSRGAARQKAWRQGKIKAKRAAAEEKRAAKKAREEAKKAEGAKRKDEEMSKEEREHAKILEREEREEERERAKMAEEGEKRGEKEGEERERVNMTDEEKWEEMERTTMAENGENQPENPLKVQDAFADSLPKDRPVATKSIKQLQLILSALKSHPPGFRVDEVIPSKKDAKRRAKFARRSHKGRRDSSRSSPESIRGPKAQPEAQPDGPAHIFF